MQTFWMVYVEGSASIPVKKHESRTLALKEAHHLIKQNGRETYVLRATDHFSVEVKHNSLD